jgi:hypothetical protein
MSTSEIEPRKIAIIETSQEKRDYLKSILSQWGHIPFLFEKEIGCLYNIAPLSPDLVISGKLPPERTFRFINTLKICNCNAPVLLISDEQAAEFFFEKKGNMAPLRNDRFQIIPFLRTGLDDCDFTRFNLGRSHE